MVTKKQLDNFEFGVNGWGSCQYAGAKHVYELFMAHVAKKGVEETAHEFEQLGMTIERKLVDNPVDEVREAILKYLADCLFDADAQLQKMIDNMEIVDDAFEILRSMAWDLWSAAPFVATAVGIRLADVPKGKGIGPEINVLVQGENIATGIYCGLLMAMEVVHDEKAFADFDT